MLFDYVAAVINDYTAAYPTWLVLTTSALVVILSWFLAEMGILTKSKFVVKDKVNRHNVSECITNALAAAC